MAAPTFVADYEGASWDTTTSPKTTAAFDIASGDLLVTGLVDENFSTNNNFTFSNSGTALTWTEQTYSWVNNSDCMVQTATAPVSAAQPGITVSGTRAAGTADKFNIVVARFSGSDGLGATAGAVGVTGASPSVSITTTAADSALFVVAGDWGAQAAPSRTWSTINGYTPTAANGLELVYFNNTTNYTVHAAYYPNVGAAGAKTITLSGLTASSDTSFAVVEIKGTAAGPTPISGTDTGALTEGTPTLLRSSTVTDSAAFADALNALTSTLSATDAAALAEAVAIALGVTDSASLTETAALTGTVTGTDTAALADAAAITVTLTATDALTLTDTGTVDSGATAVSGTDSAALTETAALTVTLTGTDTGAAADATTGSASTTASDTGALTDTGSVFAGQNIAGTDTGSLSEVATIVATLTALETLTATEQGSILATLTTTDAASTTDAGSVLDLTTPIVTPASRTLTVGAETRVLEVGAEVRTMTVAAETRTLTA